MKPLIINASNSTIVAGHQRKKAVLALGVEYLPCVKINNPNVRNEIQFKIIHKLY